MNTNDVQVFEQTRPALLGLARRILDSAADAEDVVQDCFLRWLECDRASVVSPAAWLKTVCTRRCLDRLRAADRARVEYEGIAVRESHEPAGSTASVDVCAATDQAFLLMLQRLTAKECAAWLLHEILEQPFRRIARALGMTEGACQKLVERARIHVEDARTRRSISPEVRARLLSAFRSAIGAGNPARLVALLARDVRVGARAGERAALRVVPGPGHAIRMGHCNLRGESREQRSTGYGADHRRSRQDRRSRQRAA